MNAWVVHALIIAESGSLLVFMTQLDRGTLLIRNRSLL